MGVAAPNQGYLFLLRSGIEFRRVGFRYPESEEWALRDIDLTIRPGEKIALVGPNGAGKTDPDQTLEPPLRSTEGMILIEGVDIRDWTRSTSGKESASSSGFRALSLAASEHRFWSSRSIGQVGAKSSNRAQEGAHSIIEICRTAYQTMLDAAFHGGHELFRWTMQKIALPEPS